MKRFIAAIVLTFLATPSFGMSPITKPYTFANGAGNKVDAVKINADYDTAYSAINNIIAEANLAAGTQPTIHDRLNVSINADGTLKTSITAGGDWINPGFTDTYASATTFTVSGDHTDIYKAGRRLKITLTASTVYSEVVSSSYSGGTLLTTVTILDSVLTNPITSVEHGPMPLASDGAISPKTIQVGGVIVSGLTGNVTGNVTGNLTGTASSATNADTVDTFHASTTPGANIIPVGDANGRIAWEAKPALRGALVTASGTTTITAGGVTPIVFDQETYDTSAIHDNIANNTRLTVPSGATKIELVGHATTTTANTNGFRQLSIYKNGTITVYKVGVGAVGYAVPLMIVTPTISTVAGDYYELVYYQDSGTTLAVAIGASFSMKVTE